MRQLLAAAVGILVVTGSAMACSRAPGRGPDQPGAGFEMLVFSRTTGFRHESIPAGLETLRHLGAGAGFRVTATENADVFTTSKLKGFRLVVFFNTSGDVLDAGQQAAFEAYIRGGGGFVGVHSAADTEYDWPFYGGLVGAYFARHPAVQEATIRVEDRSHPAVAHVGEAWTRRDEWYDFRTNPRDSGVRVLAVLDETSYEGGGMGSDHPFAWCHEYEGGRAFYTTGGHTVESYAEKAFRDHLLGGIRYAAGV